VNLPIVHAEGGEMSLQARLVGDLSVEPYVSYTLTRNETTGASLRDVPRWLAGGNLIWHPVEAVTVNLAVSRVGSYTDNAIPTGDVRLAGHRRVDLSATWQPQPHMKIYLSVENLLNES